MIRPFLILKKFFKVLLKKTIAKWFENRFPKQKSLFLLPLPLFLVSIPRLLAAGLLCSSARTYGLAAAAAAARSLCRPLPQPHTPASMLGLGPTLLTA